MKINYSLSPPTFSTESEVEPITLAEAKAWLKIGVTDDDTIITSLITTARKQLEDYLNISLITRTVTAYIQNDLGDIMLPYQPMQPADDEAEDIDFISIVDGDDNTISAANYKLIGGEFKRLRTNGGLGNVGTARNNFYTPCNSYLVVVYNAGYAILPEVFKTAIKEQIDWLYNNRGSENGEEISPAVKSTLKSYRKVS